MPFARPVKKKVFSWKHRSNNNFILGLEINGPGGQPLVEPRIFNLGFPRTMPTCLNDETMRQLFSIVLFIVCKNKIEKAVPVPGEGPY